LFPHVIRVRVERSKDGGFCAKIITFPGCFTEANTFSELIEMVNDAIKTYFEIPDKYIPFMPNYVPPIRVARKLDIFPPIANKDLKVMNLELPNRETIAC
jgi:predicted RNase H-like HicB family nuclease